MQRFNNKNQELLLSNKAKKKTFILGMTKEQCFFYFSILLLPVLQFIAFYLYVNFNSFLLGFKTYNYDTSTYDWYGIGNFTQIFVDFGTVPYLIASVKNSIEVFLLTLVFGSFVAVLFSYYIFKKYTGSKIFKIILYVPHIISTVTFVIMYMYFVDIAVPYMINKIFNVSIEGLLANQRSTKITILFFTIWIGFGTQVLLYTGAMSGISESIIESAKLDGITPMKELIFIVVPMIWPTFVTFMVVGIAGIFTNQMSLFSFYGTGADYSLYTFGYYLYAYAQKGNLYNFPYLSAMGLLMTAIAVPLTLFIKWALEKFGPKTV